MSHAPQIERRTVERVVAFAKELRDKAPPDLEMADLLALMFVAECGKERQTPHEVFGRLASAALHLRQTFLRSAFTERADHERKQAN
jgi:hypothetical protein